VQPLIVNTGVEWWNGIVLACTLATAFVAHYNAPRFHAELSAANTGGDNNNWLESTGTSSGSGSSAMTDRFNAVTGASFGISALFFAVTAAAGFLTFGGNSQGLILNNFSVADPLAGLSRAALTAAMILTFPLPFVGLRDGVMDMLQMPVPKSSSEISEDDGFRMASVSVGLLLALTAAATNLHDLSLVLSVGGGTFSTAVAAVFPTLMFRSLGSSSSKTTTPEVETTGESANPFSSWLSEANFALAGMVASVGIGLSGAGMAIEKVLH